MLENIADMMGYQNEIGAAIGIVVFAFCWMILLTLDVGESKYGAYLKSAGYVLTLTAMLLSVIALAPLSEQFISNSPAEYGAVSALVLLACGFMWVGALPLSDQTRRIRRLEKMLEILENVREEEE